MTTAPSFRKEPSQTSRGRDRRTSVALLGFTLGRALGLTPPGNPPQSHALGTTGVALDTDDIKRARRVAKTVSGVMTVAEARQAADAAQTAGHAELAKRHRAWLVEIARTANPKDDTKSCGEAADAAPES